MFLISMFWVHKINLTNLLYYFTTAAETATNTKLPADMSLWEAD